MRLHWEEPGDETTLRGVWGRDYIGRSLGTRLHWEEPGDKTTLGDYSKGNQASFESHRLTDMLCIVSVLTSAFHTALSFIHLHVIYYNTTYSHS